MASKASAQAAFAAHHRRDRAMVAGIVFLVWLAIVTGFGIDIVRRAHDNSLHFPLIVHLHVVAYGSWLLLLAAQVWLVRTQRVALHRRLGMAALVLIPLMLVLGPATAIAGIVSMPSMPDRWVAWLSVNLANTFGSVCLLAAGYAMRRDAASHKRLMLMGTIAVTEPGFSRIWLSALVDRLGEGYLPFYVETFIGTFVLVIAVGAYDLATRGRLHPAYVASALWIFANEGLATWLYYQPFWLHAVRTMAGHGG